MPTFFERRVMNEQPNFYAVIPANVRYADITPNAKLLYGEITALCNKDGYCYATNEYFAKLYNVSKVSISKWVKELVINGFITSEIVYRVGTKEILNRYIRIVYDPIKEKFNTPIKEKFKDNNTYINNTLNNTYNNYIYVGELKNVKLTQEEYDKLRFKYSNLDEAIEKLDTWLGTSGSKNKNKDHYAYFKENSWVWDNIKKQKNEVKELVW